MKAVANPRASELLRNRLPCLQIKPIAHIEEIIELAVVVLAVVDGDFALADHFHRDSLDHDGGGCIKADGISGVVGSRGVGRVVSRNRSISEAGLVKIKWPRPTP